MYSQRRTSAPRPSRTFSNQSGSASDARAMPMMSASPHASIASASSNVPMPPEVTTGVSKPASRTARRMAAASGTFRENGPRASILTVGMHSWPEGPV